MMALSYHHLADITDDKIGTRDVPCPLCGPERRAKENQRRRVLRIWHREAGFATYACARCGERGYARQDGVTRHVAPHKTPSVEEDLDREKRVEFALAIWTAAARLQDTLGWRYFTERRGLQVGKLGELDQALRWHDGIGAVVGLMTDPITNAPTGVHRTFLNSDATKRARKMLGRQGVIRLTQDEDVVEGLGIVEGVEDGLAVLLSGWAPCWVATSAGALERFPVLGGIQSLTLFGDDDEAGSTAVRVCAKRWMSASREVRCARLKDVLQ